MDGSVGVVVVARARARARPPPPRARSGLARTLMMMNGRPNSSNARLIARDRSSRTRDVAHPSARAGRRRRRGPTRGRLRVCFIDDGPTIVRKGASYTTARRRKDAVGDRPHRIVTQ